MSGAKKSWGFPRWGGYGQEREAVTQRRCDFEGCDSAGRHPAPKSPHSEDKWWFCKDHAAEYNRGWNFFEGMSDEEASDFARGERRFADSFADAGTWKWGGAEDEAGVTRVERDAYAALDLETDASPDDVKTQYRKLAKTYHPDRNPGDREAQSRFLKVTAAYELLRGRGRG